MGLLGFIAGGVGDAGLKVAAKAGDYLEKSTLQEEAQAAQALRDERLNEMGAKRETDLATLNSGLRTKEAKEQAQGKIDVETDPANVAKRAAAATTVYNAQVLAETDPKNLELKAAAKKAEAQSADALLAEQLKDPKFLKNRQALIAAEHPERVAAAAASMAAASKAKFELETEKGIVAARDALAKAATPEAREAAKKSLEALQWSVASDRAQKTADVGVMKVLQDQIHDKQLVIQNPMTDPAVAASEKKKLEALESTLGAYQRRYAEDAGVKVDASKAPPATGIPQGAIDYLKANPGSAAAFKQKYGVDPAQYLTKDTKPAEEKTTMLPPGAPSPNEKVNADRRAAVAAAEAAEAEKARQKRLADRRADEAVSAGFAQLSR